MVFTYPYNVLFAYLYVYISNADNAIVSPNTDDVQLNRKKFTDKRNKYEYAAL